MVSLLAPIEVGSANQLLFDDELVAESEGFVLETTPGVKDGVVLEPERPWEARGIWAWGSVIQEAGVIRLWYDAVGEDDVWRLCYAVSTDGLRFVRPELGLYEYAGGRDNNICFVAPKGYHAGTVFHAPAGGPEERYKLVYGGGGPIGDTPYLHISGAVSPDGLHWRHAANRITPWYTDTMNVAFWDPVVARYRLYVRYWTGALRYEDDRLLGRDDYGLRGIGYTESADFLDFPRPRLILGPDDRDPSDMDLYNSAARLYPLADRAYMMFISAFYHDPDFLDVQLATSRDGVTWRREAREPVVTLGHAGSFDAQQIYMFAGQAVVGDEVWMYYGGYDMPHGASYPGQVTARVGRVRWLRDRFAGWAVDMGGGELITKPLAFEGGRLTLNCDASAGGVVRVGLESPDGTPIEGFGVEDCKSLYGNHLAAVVTWKGDDLEPLAQRPVRLRIQARAAKIYSFRFGV